MIGVTVQISCEQWSKSVGNPPSCTAVPAQLEFDPATMDLAKFVAELPSGLGYVAGGDGKLYCSRHDPASAGTVHEIVNEYVEIAPGIQVRTEGVVMWPSRIEVRTEQPPKPMDWHWRTTNRGLRTTHFVFDVGYANEDAGRGHDSILRALGAVQSVEPYRESEPAE